MSDIEEPPTKVTKFQLENQYLQGEVEEEQEDWLTEGVLTDEDYSQVTQEHQDSSQEVPSEDGTVERLDSTEETESQEYQEQTEDIADGEVERLDSTEELESEEYQITGQAEMETHQEHSDTETMEVQQSGSNIELHEDSQEPGSPTILENVQLNNGVVVVQSQVSQEANIESEDIEEALINLERAKNNNQSALPEALNPFLIRKPDPPRRQEEEQKVKESDRREDDGGNDTDDLLRMLGDGDEKKVHKLRIRKRHTAYEEQESSDDEFVFTSSQMKTMKVVKGALQKCPPKRAEPEDDLTDASSDEDVKQIKNSVATTRTQRTIVKRPLQQRTQEQQKRLQQQQKPPLAQSTPLRQTQTERVTRSNASLPQTERVTRSNSNVAQGKDTRSKTNVAQSDVTRSNTNVAKSEVTRSKTNVAKSELTRSKTDVAKSEVTRSNDSIAKSEVTRSNNSVAKSEVTRSKTNMPKSEVTRSKTNVAKSEVTRSNTNLAKSEVTRSKINVAKSEVTRSKINVAKSEVTRSNTNVAKSEVNRSNEAQGEVTRSNTSVQIKKISQPRPEPERMDEEMPEDSDSDDQSIYDDIPSDESEGLDDWFTIDIRAERAGDYLPLLGDKAYKILQEEKIRVESKLAELKQSVSKLTESAKIQAEESRRASCTLAQLDALLKVT